LLLAKKNLKWTKVFVKDLYWRNTSNASFKINWMKVRKMNMNRSLFVGQEYIRHNL